MIDYKKYGIGGREHLLRAWGVHEKRMYHFDLAKDVYAEEMIDSETPLTIDYALSTLEDYVVMDYSNEKDKNGSKTFEGDIVSGFGIDAKKNITETRYVVCNGYYNNGELEDDISGNGWYLIAKIFIRGGIVECKTDEIWDFIFPNPSILEVTGNIFENENLLTNLK